MSSKKKRSLVSRLKMTLLIIGGLLGLLVLFIVPFYFWASSGTLPPEKMSEIIHYPEAEKETTAPAGDGQTFTVMSFNIGYLSGLTNNKAVKPDEKLFDDNMERFLQLSVKIKPDIIGFQEIDYDSKRSFYVDQLRTIAENAGYPHAARAVNWDDRYVPFPYWPPSVHFGKVLSGQAVLSRFPIIAAERVVLQKPKNPFFYNALYLDRLVQVVKIKIKTNGQWSTFNSQLSMEKELIILNVHLEAFSRRTRQKQAKKVLEIYQSYKDDYPVLLLGDFNCVPPAAKLKNGFSDEPETDYSGEKTIRYFLEEESLKVAELSFQTFPSDKPNRKLDYVFYNHRKIDLKEAFIVPGIRSSDHLPLVVRFSFKDIIEQPTEHTEDTEDTEETEQ